MESLVLGGIRSSINMPKLAKIKANILVVIQEKDGVYYARCPFLNVASRADSPDRAFENLNEEIQFLFSSALQDGSFIELLDYRTSQRRDQSSPDDFVQLEIRSTDLELPDDIPVHLLKRFVDAPELSA